MAETSRDAVGTPARLVAISAAGATVDRRGAQGDRPPDTPVIR